jgi:hypothetical protein
MSQAAQLGQQGSDRGQYGQTPMATPYGMNGMANANMQQNENTQNVGDYSPMLPANTLTQGQPKQWYPGIYPSTQPQFGTNPYSPQTANVSGHPGHNPSTLPAVEPNQPNIAYSNQGQFVKTMASGGGSFSGPAKKWAGPVHTNTKNQNDFANLFSGQAFPAIFGGVKGPSNNQFPGYSYNESGNYYTNEKGQKFTAVPNPEPAPSNNFGMFGGFNSIGTSNPLGLNPLGLPSSESSYKPYILEPMATPSFKPPVQKLTNVYKPQYAPMPVMSNMDSWGNPLY